MYGRIPLVCLTSLSIFGCNEPNGPGAANPATAAASAPEFTRTATATATTAPAAAATTAAEGDPEPSASTEAAGEDLPEVEIKTIGMHIGGGPNDRETKAPIRRAIEGKSDAFRACYAKVDEPAKGGTFGVDVRIPGAGGKARIRDPRDGLKGEGVEACMVAAFESVEFDKPPKGVDMMVSYSLRFTPK